MARVGDKLAWWKVLLLILAIVAILTGILYLEVYKPMLEQLAATPTPVATIIP